MIYNLYGSTEIAYATIATPEDLREEPSTVGKVVRGSIVKLLDEDGKEVGQGETGRIFVGNISQFEGYTGGGNKDMVAGPDVLRRRRPLRRRRVACTSTGATTR